MKDKDKTKEQLINELVDLRQRVAELEASEAERKRAEEALRESEEELRAIFDGVGDGIALIDVTGKVVRVNKRITDVGEYAEEEIVGKRFELLKMFPPRSLAKMLSNFTKLISGQQIPPFEVQVYTKAGGKMNVELRGSLLRQRGRTVGMVGVMRDITERKRAEEALRASEDRYRTLFEKAPASITLVDQSGVIIDCNKSTEELIGYSKEEIVGEPFEKLLTLDPKDLPQLRENFEKLSKGLEVDPYDLEIIRKDGKRRWINVTNSLLTRDGVVVGFQIISRDITERRQLQQEIEERRLYLENVLACAPDAIVTLDAQHKILEWNPGAERLFGYTVEEVVGRNIDELIAGSDAEAFEEATGLTRQVLSGKDVPPTETVRYRKDGSLAHVIVAASPILTANELVGVVAAYTDVTKLKKAEEALRRRAEELAALQATVLDITAPHDLPTLLQVIVERAARLLNAPSGGMYLCDPDQEKARCVVSYNTPCDYTGTVLKYGEGAAGIVAQTGQPLVVDDYRTWSRRAAVYEEEQPFTTVLSVPMIWEDQVTGVIHVLDDVESRRFTQEDLELLTLFTNHAAIAVENARLHQEVQHRVDELVFLNRVGRAVTSSLDPEQVLTTVMREATDMLKLEAASVLLLEEENEELVLETVVGPRAEKVKGLRVPLGQGIAGWVAREDQRLLVPDVKEDPRFYPGIDEATGFVTRSVLAVPLKVRGKVIGVIEAVNKVEGYFAQADMALLSSMAHWAAIAIENAQLFAETQRRFGEMAALHDTSLDITARLEMPELLKSIVERAVILLRSDAGGIYLYDPAREELKMVVGYDYSEKYMGTTLRPGEGMAGRVFQTGEPLIVDDYRTWEGRAAAFEADQYFTAVLEVPLKWQEQVIGVLVIDADARKRTFNQEDVWLSTLFANQAAVAIENARIYEEERKRVTQLELIAGITQKIVSILDLDELLHQVVHLIGDTFGYYYASILLVETDSNELVLRAGTGPLSETLVNRLRLKIGLEGITGWVAHSGEPLLVNDVGCEPRYYSLGAIKDAGSELAVPIKLKGEIIGVLDVLSVELDAFRQDDVSILQTLADQLAIAIENARLYEELQERMEELKRTQAQLLQAQKMEAIGQLASGIAHDFNNLLTSIGGFTELLLQEAPEGSQQQEDLHQIKVAAERAADLTRQLLLFTRQKEGERRPVQLNSLVKETHDLLERSISKEITIELHLESGLWAVEADSSQMSQVLMNLCVNARDVMPGGGTLTLETRNVILDEDQARAILAAQPGRYVRLSVSDTGCGMSPEVQARLFEPFFTTKEVGQGTGLGLAVVYGIVRGHGGFINVYSEEGQGSTFRIYLLAIESAVEEKEAEVLELSTGTETILLVDDEESVRELGQRILGRCGYTVLTAGNGIEALEVYQAHQGEIALVVLDVVMPAMGGRECLRRLREMDAQVKVLISTGYTADRSVQKLVAEGALGVVEKPFLLQDFAVGVRGALDKS